MYFSDFDEVVARIKGTGSRKRRVALISAQDEHALEAVEAARREGLVNALYVGIRSEIHAKAKMLGIEIDDCDILDAQTPSAAAELGVRLIHEGSADLLMKGLLETAQLLKPVVNHGTGLGRGGVMSHIAMMKVPAYHKIITTTDGGMIPYPTLEQKRAIIVNAVTALRAMGYDMPKVAVLACVETINPKMPETLDAAALKEMNRRGDIADCIVEGPISLDLALVREKAQIKGYVSEVAGDADILVTPNIHCGNILGKAMVELSGATMAGLIVGAICPIVVTSRAASAYEKHISLAIAAAACP